MTLLNRPPVAARPGFCADGYRQAQDALDSVTSDGPFALEGTRQFDFLTHAGFVAKLRAFQKEFYAYEGDPDWSEAIQREKRRLFERLKRAMRAAGPDAKVVTRELGTSSRLRAIPSSDAHKK